ncbi:MAG: transposase [Fimbriimonadaceae bacterium]|nr:transposase [Fimbriimonadaceae bacterium]
MSDPVAHHLVAGHHTRFAVAERPAKNFVSRLRAELLDVEVFHNLSDAQVKLAIFRRFYNEHRPHSSLGYRTPAEALLSSPTGDNS